MLKTGVFPDRAAFVDGGKLYKLTIPQPVPVTLFTSFSSTSDRSAALPWSV
jgi:hypothetical protein